VRGFNNATALHILPLLRESVQVPRAKLLLDHGADINAVCDRGMTPLMVAAQNYGSELAMFLLDRGADIHLLDQNGRNAAIWLNVEGRLDQEMLLQRLVEAGVDPGLQDKLGFDVRDYAVANGNTDLLAFLGQLPRAWGAPPIAPMLTNTTRSLDPLARLPKLGIEMTSHYERDYFESLVDLETGQPYSIDFKDYQGKVTVVFFIAESNEVDYAADLRHFVKYFQPYLEKDLIQFKTVLDYSLHNQSEADMIQQDQASNLAKIEGQRFIPVYKTPSYACIQPSPLNELVLVNATGHIEAVGQMGGLKRWLSVIERLCEEAAFQQKLAQEGAKS
jgi:ankyrin repeat protein